MKTFKAWLNNEFFGWSRMGGKNHMSQIVTCAVTENKDTTTELVKSISLRTVL